MAGSPSEKFRLLLPITLRQIAWPALEWYTPERAPQDRVAEPDISTVEKVSKRHSDARWRRHGILGARPSLAVELVDRSDARLLAKRLAFGSGGKLVEADDRVAKADRFSRVRSLRSLRAEEDLTAASRGAIGRTSAHACPCLTRHTLRDFERRFGSWVGPHGPLSAEDRRLLLICHGLRPRRALRGG
eukprot:2791041-Prymnesium_polylepis.2